MAGRWSVIAQRQYDELTPQGTFRKVVEVTFELASGTIGRVTVPSNLYSEDYVSGKIEDAAANMIAVENLSG